MRLCQQYWGEWCVGEHFVPAILLCVMLKPYWDDEMAAEECPTPLTIMASQVSSPNYLLLTMSL